MISTGIRHGDIVAAVAVYLVELDVAPPGSFTWTGRAGAMPGVPARLYRIRVDLDVVSPGGARQSALRAPALKTRIALDECLDIAPARRQSAADSCLSEWRRMVWRPSSAVSSGRCGMVTPWRCLKRYSGGSSRAPGFPQTGLAKPFQDDG